MCQAIGAHLLIDDSLKYALQVAGDAGIEVLLFGTRGRFGVCLVAWSRLDCWCQPVRDSHIYTHTYRRLPLEPAATFLERQRRQR